MKSIAYQVQAAERELDVRLKIMSQKPPAHGISCRVSAMRSIVHTLRVVKRLHDEGRWQDLLTTEEKALCKPSHP